MYNLNNIKEKNKQEALIEMINNYFSENASSIKKTLKPYLEKMILNEKEFINYDDYDKNIIKGILTNFIDLSNIFNSNKPLYLTSHEIKDDDLNFLFKEFKSAVNLLKIEILLRQATKELEEQKSKKV